MCLFILILLLVTIVNENYEALHKAMFCGLITGDNAAKAIKLIAHPKKFKNRQMVINL